MTNEYLRMKLPQVSGLVLVVGLGGCSHFTEPNPLSCLDGYCSDEDHPFCDVDGSFGGTPGLCHAVECTPLEFGACRGDDALICNATGDNYDLTHCDFGCGDQAGGCKQCTPGTPGCDVRIIPKYLPYVCDHAATISDLTIGTSMELDTDVDASCNGGLVTQTHGPTICVVRYGTITVDTNKTLTVTGKRALALVADQAVTINGVLDVGATYSENGPGGGTITSGLEVHSPLGGGGAGFKTPGAPGGTTTTDGGANNEGAATSDPALSVELVGGSRASGNGGGGGGAVMLISCGAGVSLAGLVDAGGGGGQGGFIFSVPPYSEAEAGGGGAGGNVVLQGIAVSVTGQAFANGGGGGAGMIAGGGPGYPGGNGSLSASYPALGGSSMAGEGGGGYGGIGGAEPEPGKKPSTAGLAAGGGGGSTGYLKTYTPLGVTPFITPASASPAFDAPGTVPTGARR